MCEIEKLYLPSCHGVCSVMLTSLRKLLRNLVLCPLSETWKRVIDSQAMTMVEIPDTFSAIHLVKTDTFLLLKPSVTHTHTLPHATAFPTPWAMSNRRVIPGSHWEAQITYMPGPERSGQMVCRNSLEARKPGQHCLEMREGHRNKGGGGFLEAC